MSGPHTEEPTTWPLADHMAAPEQDPGKMPRPARQSRLEAPRRELRKAIGDIGSEWNLDRADEIELLTQALVESVSRWRRKHR